MEPRPLPTVRYRFASDTGTAAKGAVDMEFGLHAGPRHTRDTPLELQWGVARSTEVFSGWSPYTQDESGDESSIGDVALGLRHRFLEETRSRPSMLVELWTTLPTGDKEDSFNDKVDTFTGLAATKTLEHMTATAYYQLGLIEDDDDSDNDALHLFTLTSSIPLSKPFHLYGEVGATREPHTHDDFWFTSAGSTWTLANGAVLDCGLAYVGGNGESDVEFFVGISRGLIAPRHARPSAPSAPSAP